MTYSTTQEQFYERIVEAFIANGIRDVESLWTTMVKGKRGTDPSQLTMTAVRSNGQHIHLVQLVGFSPNGGGPESLDELGEADRNSLMTRFLISVAPLCKELHEDMCPSEFPLQHGVQAYVYELNNQEPVEPVYHPTNIVTILRGNISP